MTLAEMLAELIEAQHRLGPDFPVYVLQNNEGWFPTTRCVVGYNAVYIYPNLDTRPLR